MTQLQEHFKETEELFDEQFEDRDFCGCYEGDVMGNFKNGSKKCKDFIHSREKALVEKIITRLRLMLRISPNTNKLDIVHNTVEKANMSFNKGYNQALSDIQYILKELL